MEDLQNVMDPLTAEEPLGGTAERRCGQEGCGKMRVRARLQRAVTLRREWSDTQGGDGKGKEEWSRRLEGKQQDACLVAPLSLLYMCSWTPKELYHCSYHSLSVNRLLTGLWSEPNTESSVYKNTHRTRGTSVRSYTRHAAPNNCRRMPADPGGCVALVTGPGLALIQVSQ